MESKIEKNMVKNKIKAAHKKKISLRKQLVTTITLCCIIVVSIQAIVMVAIIISQYVAREKENVLYLLESDNVKIEDAFRYVEDVAVSIQHDVGLRNFFQESKYGEEEAERQLKRITDFFSRRNRLTEGEPFVEKIYLFNEAGKTICNLYYPVTIAEMQKLEERYRKLYQSYNQSQDDFYFQADNGHINLCMRLYDNRMKSLGGCIFVLNKTGIENVFSNLEEMKYFCWSITQKEEVILGNASLVPEGMAHVLKDEKEIGFGLTISAAVSQKVLYHSLGDNIGTILLISTMLIFTLSLWGYRASRNYVRPLETIAEKIELVGKGNFDTKLDEYSIEELQNISRTFNEMTDYIERLIKEVYETQLSAQQAQIQYLQAQMNPHFLFNVLSMIKMKAAMNQDTEVQEMLYKLSGLYQGKIFRREEYFIFLEEEMEIVDFYLSLQSSRFGEKLDYSICYEGNPKDYHKLMVPRLSIEPIVENAVCHGLEPKEGKGAIKVKVRKEDAVLKIRIEDNGVGFDLQKLMENEKDRNHSHVGLWNTNQMICNLCGKEYGLEITSKIGEGTIIGIILPVKNGEIYVESNDSR